MIVGAKVEVLSEIQILRVQFFVVLVWYLITYNIKVQFLLDT